MSEPVDKALYERVKRQVKKRVDVWPSAYASGQVVREYKRRGGRYRNKKSRSKRSKSKRGGRREGGLSRWFEEDWRNVCAKTRSGKYKKCGRRSASSGGSYPYCRPTKRVSSRTPKTWREMSKSEISSMCRRKRGPKRVYVSKSRRRKTKSRKRKTKSRRTRRQKSRRRRSRTNRTRRKSRQTKSRRTKSRRGASVVMGASSTRSLPKGLRFERGPGRYKYTAVFADGKRVNFGHRDYEHYRDSVPRSRGGGKWSHKDHGDKSRRKSYRARHGGIRSSGGKRAVSKRYSPAWFSYHFLW